MDKFTQFTNWVECTVQLIEHEKERCEDEDMLEEVPDLERDIATGNELLGFLQTHSHQIEQMLKGWVVRW